MRFRFVVTLFFLFFSVAANSQVNTKGAPLVSWFDAVDIPGDLRNWCITMDKCGVMYFGNESKGIVTYNGLKWDLIKMGSQQRVNALATDYRGIVYVGGETDFGFLQPDNKGELQYRSLADRLTDSLVRSKMQMITSIAADSNTVFFTDRRSLFLYDLNKDSLSVIDISKKYNLKNAGRILVKDGRVIIADDRLGLFEYRKGTLARIPGSNKLGMKRYMALLPFDRENIVLATFSHGIYLFNMRTGELKSNFLPEAINNKLKENHISDAVNIPGNRFAVGVTGGEGVYIFSHAGILLQQVSVETTGIKEATVTAMYCDYVSNSQLWFCTMGYINRAYVSLPVSEFGSGTGIKTTIGDIVEYDGSVFVSSDAGLFRSFVNDSGVVHFSKLEEIEDKATDLLTTTLQNGMVLIASAANGLYQIDEEGSISNYVNGVSLTSMKVDMNDPTTILAGATDGIILTLRNSDKEWTVTYKSNRNSVRGVVRTIEQSGEGEWWIQTAGPCSLYRLDCSPSDTNCIIYDRTKGLESDTINYIVTIDKMLYVCTGRGIYRYDRENDRFIKDNDLIGNTFSNICVDRLFKTPEGDICVAGFDTHYFTALVTPTRQGHVIFRRQFDFLPDISTSDIEYIANNIWLAKGKSIYVIDKSNLGYGYGSFSTLFTGITAGNNDILLNGQFYTTTPEGIRIPSLVQPKKKKPSLKYSRNAISFTWTTTSYVGEEKTEYRYKLDGLDKDWSKWEKRNSRDFTSLPFGHYTFRLISKTLTGLESKEVDYSFSVRKPWYAIFPVLLLFILIGLLAVYALTRFYTWRLRSENIRLENLVKQRNTLVNRQKEELDASVHYASRIQRALLPSEKVLADATFNNYFILFKPLDKVSGDFYWMARKDDRLYVAAADCTGHGVPGAFMSLLCISFLDEIINKVTLTKPGIILDELRKQVVNSLKQTGETDEQKDAIDLAIIAVDFKRHVVEFAGAYNPCFKVRAMNNEEILRWESGDLETEEGSLSNGKYLLETVAADKMPIGISSKMDKAFKQTEWKLERDYSYYLFTDGYIDQFNGNTGKKFMKRNFKKLILDIQDYPMSKQKEILEERLLSWMGSSPQIDDILVVGLKAEWPTI